MYCCIMFIMIKKLIEQEIFFTVMTLSSFLTVSISDESDVQSQVIFRLVLFLVTLIFLSKLKYYESMNLFVLKMKDKEIC